MPHPSEATPRHPGDFADALATRDPVLLVGRQAINLWALYYEERTKNLAPFVSRDVDVLGDRQTLSDLAAVIGAKPQFFPLKPPSNEIGVVIAHNRDGEPLLVEVLRTVHGVTNEELRQSAFEMAIGTNQVRVQVPSPITLLKAKTANVSDIAQTGRQFPPKVINRQGVEIMPMPDAGVWRFGSFIDSPDPRYRKLVGRFREAGYLESELDEYVSPATN